MSELLRNQTCEQRIGHHLEGRLGDLRSLCDAYCSGKENDENNLADYGLSFDYVAPGTFEKQHEAYFRYQLSWGGPSDEFRFFVNPDFRCHRIEYSFMDWFDGACRTVLSDDEILLLKIWDWFKEAGAAQRALDNAT